MKVIYKIVALCALCVFVNCKSEQTKDIPKLQRPNVILVMTDDQGIGDIGCHGNPWINTPNLDKFYEQSVRLTNFHVSPMCTPTRAALMTGLYPINNGVWATFKGRDVLHPSTVILPEVFKSNGYQTAIFGKWHLGDNYPSRPTDRGFDIAVQHSAGGVGELSDYWGNNYFDDVYLRNNQPEQFEGYCTDIWFDEAINFIEEKKNQPFFLYLPTNAPHHPLYVADSYAEPYRELVGEKIPNAEFYGMITNIDENFGRLERKLEELGLMENTILIFCSDNGSQFGVSEDYRLGWNNGFRGRKGEKLEAGHRVPFFVRWPEAGIQGGVDEDVLSAHVDLLPTLSGLCNLEVPPNSKFDGTDLTDVLLKRAEDMVLKDRTLFVHHRQDYRQPEPIEGTCIMKGDWRLLNGKELYNISTDKKQLNDIAKQHPEIVYDLLQENEAFIAMALDRKEYKEFAYQEAGSESQQKLKLTIQHAVGEDGPIWQTEQIAKGIRNNNALHPVSFARSGKYRISCTRWPEERPGPISGVPEVNPKNQFEYKTISPDKARINLFGRVHEKLISADDEEVVFEIELQAGKTMLETKFIEEDEEYGVYYTYIELLE